MEKPILKLSAKEFLTGVSGSNYSGHGGIFKVANGVSAVRNIGTSYETGMGLLQAGPAGASGGVGVVVDSPLVSAKAYIDATHAYMFVFGSGGHVYYKDALGGAPVDLGASNQITGFANGCAVYKPKSGTVPYLYYTQTTQIGRVSVASLPAARIGTWSDAWTGSLQSTGIHPMHNFLDQVFFGNDYLIGSIADNGSGDAVASLSALSNIPRQYQVTCLEDDGFYLVAVLSSDRQSTGGKVSNKFIFWDASSSTWQREFPVQDDISCMKRIGNVVYALGARGIYTVSFNSGVKKVWQIGSAVNSAYYGSQMLTSFNDCLVVGIAGGSVAPTSSGQVALFGKPHPLLPAAYHCPFTIDSGTGVTFVDSEFVDGILVIGDSSTALKEYAFGVTVTNRTGVNAETVYIPLDAPHIIKRVDVVFGSVLASGDDLKVEVASNDGSTYLTYGINGADVTFTTYGAKKRVSLTSNSPVKCEALKLRFTFNGGVPAIQKVEVYGQPVEPSAMV